MRWYGAISVEKYKRDGRDCEFAAHYFARTRTKTASASSVRSRASDFRGVLRKILENRNPITPHAAAYLATRNLRTMAASPPFRSA